MFDSFFLLILSLCVLFFVYRVFLISFRYQRRTRQAHSLQFLIVKIPHAGTAKQSDIQAGDNIQSMKQNLEMSPLGGQGAAGAADG